MKSQGDHPSPRCEGEHDADDKDAEIVTAAALGLAALHGAASLPKKGAGAGHQSEYAPKMGTAPRCRDRLPSLVRWDGVPPILAPGHQRTPRGGRQYPRSPSSRPPTAFPEYPNPPAPSFASHTRSHVHPDPGSLALPPKRRKADRQPFWSAPFQHWRETSQPWPQPSIAGGDVAAIVAAQAAPPDAITLSFPGTLHAVLASRAYRHILSWLSNGKGFVIRDRQLFASQVMPRHFDDAQFTSFTRRLKRWGFARVPMSSEIGVYHHEYFERSRPDLVWAMTCRSEGEGTTTGIGGNAEAKAPLPDGESKTRHYTGEGKEEDKEGGNDTKDCTQAETEEKKKQERDQQARSGATTDARGDTWQPNGSEINHQDTLTHVPCRRGGALSEELLTTYGPDGDCLPRLPVIVRRDQGLPRLVPPGILRKWPRYQGAPAGQRCPSWTWQQDQQRSQRIQWHQTPSSQHFSDVNDPREIPVRHLPVPYRPEACDPQDDPITSVDRRNILVAASLADNISVARKRNNSVLGMAPALDRHALLPPHCNNTIPPPEFVQEQCVRDIERRVSFGVPHNTPNDAAAPASLSTSGYRKRSNSGARVVNVDQYGASMNMAVTARDHTSKAVNVNQYGARMNIGITGRDDTSETNFSERQRQTHVPRILVNQTTSQQMLAASSIHQEILRMAARQGNPGLSHQILASSNRHQETTRMTARGLQSETASQQWQQLSQQSSLLQRSMQHQQPPPPVHQSMHAPLPVSRIQQRPPQQLPENARDLEFHAQKLQKLEEDVKKEMATAEVVMQAPLQLLRIQQQLPQQRPANTRDLESRPRMLQELDEEVKKEVLATGAMSAGVVPGVGREDPPLAPAERRKRRASAA